MSIKDTSEPAFPSENGQYFGMSLRDYFAAKAMQGLMGRSWHDVAPEELAEVWVASAYKISDLMLLERDK